LVISYNFKSLYNWCVETSLSHLYDFISLYHIAHMVTREDETDMNARYVTNTLQRGEHTSRLYFRYIIWGKH